MLGIREAEVPDALRLLRENRDLVLAPTDENDRFTISVTFDGERSRCHVIHTCRDRLKAERILRARRWEAAERRHAAAVAVTGDGR